MKKKTKNKLGQAHIEIMLSFVIFIGFLIFVLVFLNPFAKAKPDYIMNNIENAIIKNISAEIGKMSVIGDEGSNDYIILSPYNNINFVEKTDTTSPTKKCTLYFSNEIFNTKMKNCGFSAPPRFGVYSTEKMIVYEKIESLIMNYNLNYENLKSLFGISNDFVFSLRDLNGAELIKVERNIPSGIEVESKDIPIRIINSSADIKEGILNIRSW